MGYEELKFLGKAIGFTTLMCSGPRDCDNEAVFKVWIGKEDDEWVGACLDCAENAKKQNQRVEKL